MDASSLRTAVFPLRFAVATARRTCAESPSISSATSAIQAGVSTACARRALSAGNGRNTMPKLGALSASSSPFES